MVEECRRSLQGRVPTETHLQGDAAIHAFAFQNDDAPMQAAVEAGRRLPHSARAECYAGSRA